MEGMETGCLDLPPGFRFHPTDEEIVTHYLTEKVLSNSFSSRAIGEVDLNKCEPWDLPKKAKMGEKEWYFFCLRDRKYPTGMRTNRATEAGYWKATGKDKEIYRGKACLVGMKKTLVFYKGRAPKGEKSNWVMHEYRLEGKFSYCNIPKPTKDEWVVCRVFHKNNGAKRSPSGEITAVHAFGSEDHMLDSPSLPPLFDSPYLNMNHLDSSFFQGGGAASFKNTLPVSSRAPDGIPIPYFSPSPAGDLMDQKALLSSNHSVAKHQGQGNLLGFPHVSLPSPLSSAPARGDLGYLHQQLGSCSPSIPAIPISGYDAPHHLAMVAAQGSIKVEQFSTQSIVSQDTGLSNDVNTEISSVASKHEIGSSSRCYDDLEDPSSAGPVDLECLWNY